MTDLEILWLVWFFVYIATVIFYERRIGELIDRLRHYEPDEKDDVNIVWKDGRITLERKRYPDLEVKKEER